MPWNFFLIYIGSVMYFMSYSLEARRPRAAPPQPARRARGAALGRAACARCCASCAPARVRRSAPEQRLHTRVRPARAR
jgi:hypothetical protein